MQTLARRNLLLSLAAVPALLPTMLRAQAAQAGLITGNVCVLAPELAEGPFYTEPALMRRDITEGSAGTPLVMRLQVVDAACAPITGARVDVWHCDASGVYSAFAEGGGGAAAAAQSFLRGSQMTDDLGVASFVTIYPGWYPGRAVHVHYKVYLNTREMVTSQMFFAESVSREVYAASPIYAARGNADVPLDSDRIARRAGDGAVCAVEVLDGVLTASLVVGIGTAGLAG